MKRGRRRLNKGEVPFEKKLLSSLRQQMFALVMMMHFDTFAVMFREKLFAVLMRTCQNTYPCLLQCQGSSPAVILQWLSCTLTNGPGSAPFWVFRNVSRQKVVFWSM
ncbi:hypothetical protein ILYODFUR_027630 [Ilyodon furcidens]|uniref:Uncharacterized protein n=1 Tax=Ilyodon furcidens TaxID=33524 RepID=A0ABV0UCX1_9TELE